MTFTDNELDDLAEETSEVKAADSSPLTGLRAARATARTKLYTDLPIPRLEGYGVRYGIVTQRRLDQITKRFEKSKDPDRTVIVNALVLAEACQGVYEWVDGEQVSVDPEARGAAWPKFDERLAELLHDPEQPKPRATKASDVVRDLYLTDGDLIATATELAEWNGYAAQILADDPESAGN